MADPLEMSVLSRCVTVAEGFFGDSAAPPRPNAAAAAARLTLLANLGLVITLLCRWDRAVGLQGAKSG